MKHTPKQLLVIDDSALIIKRVTLALHEKLKDIDVISVLKGADALYSIQNFKPWVVLLDIQLPDISGIEVLRQIKKTYPEVKVIMLTNQSAPHIRKTCLQEGADGFYDKTREFEMAIEHIKKLDE